MSYYVHNIQGRLRVKTPLIKKNPATAQAVQRLLRRIHGVNTTTVNTLTGSAVILYDPKLVSSKEILDTLEETGYFDLSKAVTNGEYVYSAAAKTSGIICRSLVGAFVERALQGSALSLISVLI
jgi:hypothetical protein